MSSAHNTRVALVVLGDFGRSPRMQYHALAMAESRIDVDVVAYAGSAPLLALREHLGVRLHLLTPPRVWQKAGLPSALVAALMALRVCKQSLQLLWLLGLRLPKPDFILVQNPPAIPTLLVALIAARARSAKLIIDWHNFGCSMLAMQLKQGNPVLRLAQWYEQTLGRRGDGHLCVSVAMRSELAANWGIPRAIVLYDRPAAQFAPTPADVRQDLFRRIGDGLDFPWNRDRPPGLIVYPTSWTADEDFSLLLEAAIRCDAMIADHDRRDAGHPFPHLLIVITGQGPLRSRYEEEIARLRLEKVHLRTLWLAPEDYPLMLGAADMGLCCHRSSSGFDLPMKLADLMGSGVPVLALNYGACLAEQVREGETGLLFESADQLAGQLYELFNGFPASPSLDKLRDNVRRLRPMLWSEGWKAAAAPIFTAP
jgi:beta-1,4-mannosyltransferase